MTNLRLILSAVLLSVLVCSGPQATAAPADADVVTVDAVLAAMAQVPERELTGSSAPEPRPGRYDRAKDAQEIARAIAQAVNSSAPLYGSRSLTAAIEVVHGAWESGFQRCARGDHGKSWGFLQLSIAHTDRYEACDPFLAAKKWIRLAASVWCAHAPEGAELAAVESGRCDAAWDKARHRLEVARTILDTVAHAELPRE
jgi:hypothetical protein